MPTNKPLSAKVSLVITTYNEAKTIDALLISLTHQTLVPGEIVIVDANSSDQTAALIKRLQKNSPIKIKLFSRSGNRSVGRNFAISQTHYPLIAITDAGCIPEKDWLEKLVQKQQATKALVVAGFYRGLPNSALEEAIVPYALVMPSKADPDNFLPATRSMLIKKQVWQELGGFDESLVYSEDYDFARRMKKKNISIVFARRAVVGWQPRSNLSEFFLMLFRFARGDAVAGLFRIKVLLVFMRYIVLFFLSFIIVSFLAPKYLLKLWVPLGVLYGLWAVDKNVRYTPHGWVWLPILQVIADVAVMSGTLVGWLIKIRRVIFG